jgi:leader peptidase (prepilin peptidase)/N-methyltransferase
VTLLFSVAVLLGLVIGPVLHNIAIATSTRTAIGTPFGACGRCDAPRPWPYVACPNGHPGTTRERWWSLTYAAVLAGTVLVAGVTSEVTAYLVFVGVTWTLVITDVDEKLIPNKVLYPGGAAAIVLLVIEAAVSDRSDRLLPSLAAGAGYYLVFLGIHLLNRQGFGMGDVKLAFLLGFFTMFDSIRIFLLGVFFTGFIGGLPAVALLLMRKVGPKYAIPYGPAMVLGAWLAIAFGEPFLGWYLAR